VGNINIHIKETRERGGGPFSLGSEYGSIMGCCEHGYEIQSSAMCSCCGCSSLIFELCHIPDGSVALYCIRSREIYVHKILIRKHEKNIPLEDIIQVYLQVRWVVVDCVYQVQVRNK
jgi:hypothetical protein